MKLRSRIVVFILAFLAWIALTGSLDAINILAAGLVALLVSLSAGHLLVTTRKKNPLIRRLTYAIYYLVVFIWEMIKANFHVAYIVLHPMLPIRPGIVRIKSGLKKDASLTVLSNSITLTPGTLTVDIDPGNDILYVHQIDVESEEMEVNTENIGGRFEPILTEVFE